MLKRAVAVCLVAAVCMVFVSCGKQLSKEEMVEKGKYLVSACGVLSFHTPMGKDGKPDFTKFLAGSAIGIKGPWGVWYPANLTPDIDTGIGAKTDEEVMNDIKGDSAGIRPAFLTEYYRNLSEEDVKCVVTYLRTITPVANKIPASLKPGEAVKTAVISFDAAAPKAAVPAPAVKKPAPAPAKKTTAAPAKTSTPAKKAAAPTSTKKVTTKK